MESNASAHQTGVHEGELLGAEEDVVHGLHADQAAVVLVRHLVLVRPEAAAGPDVLLLQPRQGDPEGGVAVQRGRGIAVLQTAVVDGHDLVGGGDHVRVDGALDGLLHDGVQVHGLVLLGLGHLEHQRPVWAGACTGVLHGQGGVAVSQSGQGGIGGGRVLDSVVREDSAAIERTVVLWVVHPALVVVGRVSAQPQTDDVRRRVGQSLGQVVATQPVQGQIQRNRGQQLKRRWMKRVISYIAVEIE